jgi:hypothetical protein
MRTVFWFALATLAVIVTLNAWLIIQMLRAARRTVVVPQRAAGGFGSVWVETHSTQKSMNVRILRDRYLRLT